MYSRPELKWMKPKPKLKIKLNANPQKKKTGILNTNVLWNKNSPKTTSKFKLEIVEQKEQEGKEEEKRNKKEEKNNKGKKYHGMFYRGTFRIERKNFEWWINGGAWGALGYNVYYHPTTTSIAKKNHSRRNVKM